LIKKIKVQSQTTAGHKMELRSFLAELMLIRQYGLQSLCPYFWRHKYWRGLYTVEVRAISKFLKSYGQEAVIAVIGNIKINTFTNYAELEYFLQKIRAANNRLAKPKDTTKIINETCTVEDLREPRFFVKSKGMFERIDELYE
jgi:hypothetical protein